MDINYRKFFVVLQVKFTENADREERVLEFQPPPHPKTHKYTHLWIVKTPFSSIKRRCPINARPIQKNMPFIRGKSENSAAELGDNMPLVRRGHVTPILPLNNELESC